MIIGGHWALGPKIERLNILVISKSVSDVFKEETVHLQITSNKRNRRMFCLQIEQVESRRALGEFLGEIPRRERLSAKEMARATITQIDHARRMWRFALGSPRGWKWPSEVEIAVILWRHLTLNITWPLVVTPIVTLIFYSDSFQCAFHSISMCSYRCPLDPYHCLLFLFSFPLLVVCVLFAKLVKSTSFSLITWECYLIVTN